jgi:hypothetical protein
MFAEFDTDGSGTVSFHEVNGEEERRARRGDSRDGGTAGWWEGSMCNISRTRQKVRPRQGGGGGVGR